MEYTVKYNGVEETLEVPKRFATQEKLAAFAADLEDGQFAVLVAVLKDRRWTNEEFATRVRPLRPEHALFAPAPEADEAE